LPSHLTITWLNADFPSIPWTEPKLLNELIFALILVLIIFKHTKCTERKVCVDMCVGHGRVALEISLSEKGALAKEGWEPLH